MQPNQSGVEQPLTPMRIARHPLFTAREKIGLLQAILTEISIADTGEEPGLDPAEVDAAIADVERQIRNGVGNRAEIEGPRDGR